MKIKQFLKPDWKKIILALILSLILPFLCTSGWNCRRIPCISHYFYIMPIGGGFFNLMTFLFRIMLGGVPFEALLMPLILFLISFIISYLLSCLIVWIYDKVKKKKR